MCWVCEPLTGHYSLLFAYLNNVMGVLIITRPLFSLFAYLNNVLGVLNIIRPLFSFDCLFK